MDTYDYRQDTDSINETQAKIDLLSEKEAKQVSEFISSLKEQSAKEQSTALLERFTSAFSIIKDFAELTGSLLTVEESKQYCVVAELTNRQGFDITESSKIIRAIFTLANHIGIGSKDGETCISSYLIVLVLNKCIMGNPII